MMKRLWLFSSFLLLFFLVPFAPSWDAVDYALAVSRFDLAAMQPHFPGYPYFIIGAKLVRSFVATDVLALSLWNVLLYIAAIGPLYYITRDKWVTLAVWTMVYPLVIVTQPMSEGGALALVIMYVASLVYALRTGKKRAYVLAVLLFSFMLGYRLSYIAFGTGLLYLLYHLMKHKRQSLLFAGLTTALAIAFQLVWVGALAISAGGIEAFWQLATSFTSGHFNEWGGTVVTEEASFSARVAKLIGVNVVWTGLASQQLALIPLLLGALFWSWKQRWSNVATMVAIVALSYFGWALFAQNVAKARHIVPLVPLIGIAIYRQLPRPMLALIIAAQLIVARPLLYEQKTAQPAMYQLANYWTTEQQSLLLTWEEERVLDYLQRPIATERVQSAAYFREVTALYDGYTIYMTDKVVNSLRSQGVELSLKKIATFKSRSLFDPVYGTIELYQLRRR